MNALAAQQSLEHLQLMENRVKILIAGRIRKRDKMELAARTIDKLRRKAKNWDSVTEIRKLRASR